jgi:hypothetical protein
MLEFLLESRERLSHVHVGIVTAQGVRDCLRWWCGAVAEVGLVALNSVPALGAGTKGHNVVRRGQEAIRVWLTAQRSKFNVDDVPDGGGVKCRWGK